MPQIFPLQMLQGNCDLVCSNSGSCCGSSYKMVECSRLLVTEIMGTHHTNTLDSYNMCQLTTTNMVTCLKSNILTEPSDPTEANKFLPPPALVKAMSCT